MTNEEKLQKIIAAYSPVVYSEIDLKKTIKDRYVAAEFKDNLCNDICHAWVNINCTALHNNMFVTLKTGEDILRILEYVGV
jgi:hypothetical protein